MTPDEHAAEAERILTGFHETLGADHTYLTYLEAAHIHALLATRPTPPAEYTPLFDDHTRQTGSAEITTWGMTRAAFVAFARDCVAERYGGVPGEVADALVEIADRLYAGPAPTTET